MGGHWPEDLGVSCWTRHIRRCVSLCLLEQEYILNDDSVQIGSLSDHLKPIVLAW